MESETRVARKTGFKEVRGSDLCVKKEGLAVFSENIPLCGEIYIFYKIRWFCRRKDKGKEGCFNDSVLKFK